MMNIAALLLAAICLQDTKIVVRQERTLYTEAVTKSKEADALIATDPQAAIDRLNEVIGNAKLRHMECNLKIERSPGDYFESMFVPYQIRGNAKVALAAKSTPENAQKLLQGAIDDFQESVKRNVPASAEPLKGAQAALAKIRADLAKVPDPAKADPVAKFREKWVPLMERKRFKAAKTAVEKDSEGLTDEDRKNFMQTTERTCQELLTRWVSEFRPQFVSAMSLGLDQKTPEEIDLLFSMPAPDELISSHPVLDWARTHQAAFRDVQSQKAPAHSLAAAALASATLEERVQNPYFTAIELAVFASMRSAINAEVERSRDATKADREKARAQADAVLNQWKAFQGKLDAKFAERHRVPDHERLLVKLFEGFPADLSDLDKIDPAVDAAFAAESPDTDLAKIEDSLSSLESRGNLTRESRQRLYTTRVTIGALRGLFNGKTEEAVASELSSLGQKLREAGGPAGDLKKFGPRVEKVFAALLR